jgi:5-methylcytosine-specific restriction endonuclease McrA
MDIILTEENLREIIHILHGEDLEVIRQDIFWIIRNSRRINDGSVSRVVTKEDRYLVLKRQKWKCNICNCNLKYNCNSGWEGEVAHIDHIFPYTMREEYINGAKNINEPANLQALCPTCNLNKNKRLIN